MPTILFLAFSLLLQGALGELICDELPVGMCAFSIATSGKRCSLETGDQSGIFQCKTSEVYVHRIREYIESDECLTACPRRAMSQLKSSGIAVSDAAAGGPISAPAPGPISGDVITGSAAPAASPPGSSAASAPAPM
ncbi:hypothetical protein ACH5RR_020721 [Cinchona calisaya]|uniref:PAR1 protein n=1 Tax=Cinchona calisaya TaxID=153742 RepID=A0ABD2ZJ41_9GENT